MWLFTTLGQFSIVRKKDGLNIRSRDRKQLRALLTKLSFPAKILTYPSADYRYRIIVTTEAQEAEVFRTLTQTVNYSNFKETIHQKHPEWLDLHFDVYTAVAIHAKPISPETYFRQVKAQKK